MVWMGGPFTPEAISSLEYDREAFPEAEKNVWVWHSGQDGILEGWNADWRNIVTANQYGWKFRDVKTELIPRLSELSAAFNGFNYEFSEAEIAFNYHLTAGNTLIPQRTLSYGLAALGDTLVIEPGAALTPAAAINESTFSSEFKVAVGELEAGKTDRVTPWALYTKRGRNRASIGQKAFRSAAENLLKLDVTRTSGLDKDRIDKLTANSLYCAICAQYSGDNPPWPEIKWPTQKTSAGTLAPDLALIRPASNQQTAQNNRYARTATMTPQPAFLPRPYTAATSRDNWTPSYIRGQVIPGQQGAFVQQGIPEQRTHASRRR